MHDRLCAHGAKAGLRALRLAVLMLLVASCSVRRYVPQDRHLLDKVRIVTDNPKAASVSDMRNYVRQHPNSRWFGLWRVPMSPYLMQGNDTTTRFDRFLRRIGEAPVIYDAGQARQSAMAMQTAVRNSGYLNAVVETDSIVSGYKATAEYRIACGPRYTIRSMHTHVADTALAMFLDSMKYQLNLPAGEPYDINVLDEHRSRLAQALLNKGYFKFNKEHINFVADTTVGNRQVDLLMRILPYHPAQNDSIAPHTRFTIGRISYLTDLGYGDIHNPDVKHSVSKGRDYYDIKRYSYRRHVLRYAIDFAENETYSESRVNFTYASLSRLGGVMTSNVYFQEADSARLNAYVGINTTRRRTLSLEPEATNSAGDFGAALVATYTNRNIFHGGEVLSLKARGAYEAIKGLKGYADQDYIEWSGEASVTLPQFMLPFVSHTFQRRSQATTEFGLTYNSQNRPEFHRRVFSGALRYKWYQFNHHMQHKLDILDLSYVYMPWISSTFKREYLEDASSRNAILRYNYENLFIMKLGYQYSYLSRNAQSGIMFGRNAYAVKFAVESSGNLLSGLTNAWGAKRNGEGSKEIFGVAFAQYVKGDFDYSRSFSFDQRNSLAVHGGLGIAYPYGNSTILPYEKRYFSGGANSVRGWSVRSLGPGSYRGHDGRIDFINQTGDLRLDMNIEFRTVLFWKIHTALFVDAGNIWTLREYADQPGGQFRFDTFWRQIAVAYGLGLRLNFDYFVLRLDGGMKAINPAYMDSHEHYAAIHPRFSRDFQLHFAVGLPF